MPDVYLFLLVFGSLLAGIYMERWRALWARHIWRAKHGGGNWNGNGKPSNIYAPDNVFRPDPAEQLRTVMHANFKRRPLLSKKEARVLYKAEDTIRNAKLGWRAMAQVCLGEVLRSPDNHAFAAINSKRVDILLISSCGIPMAAIEYQGEGHYQGTAAARDAIKKEALRKAGVRYIEVTPDSDLNDLAREILRIAEQESAKVGEEETKEETKEKTHSDPDP
jgi:hypothetical protein